ncbi:MAG: hypothetical protein M3008_09545, partial [Chloroflexota bacterium]|nr:hypothetical protein [Chloroflexota bacterium]
RVRLRLIMLALLVVMCRLVMALVGRVLARRGHVGPTFRYCGRAPGAPWPAEQSIGQNRCRRDTMVSDFLGESDARDNRPFIGCSHRR